MNEIHEAIETLQSKLSTLDLFLDFLKADFDKEVDAIVARNKRSKSKRKSDPDSMRSWKAIVEFREAVFDDLMVAATLAKKYKVDATASHRLAIAIDRGMDHAAFIIDAIRELDLLKAKIAGKEEKYPGLRSWYETMMKATPEATRRMVAETYAADHGIDRNNRELIGKIETHIKNNTAHGKWGKKPKE